MSGKLVSQESKIHVYFIMLPNTVLLDVVGPAEVFQYVNRLGMGCFELHFIGPETVLDNSLGLNIQIDPLPETLMPNNWIVSSGSMGDQIVLDTLPVTKTMDWLTAQSPHIHRYISICAGTLLFAKLGLLAGRSCTTHHDHVEQLQKISPTAKVLDNRLFVEDDIFFSSAGITAGVDLALYLVQREYGDHCASRVARKMVLFSRRGPNDPSHSPWLEHRNHIHQSVHRVQDAIQSDPTRDWTLEILADIAQCSVRHVARLFKDSTGVTTRQYIHKLRLSLAMQLLESTPFPIDNIAERCGFDDPRQFRRLWARQYSAPPSHYRSRL